MLDSLKNAMRSFTEAGLGLLYPEVCQICKNERAACNQGYVGEECRKKIEFIEPPFCLQCGLPPQGAVTANYTCSNCRNTRFYFSSARGAVRVNTTALEVIHRYKYQGALYFEPFLAELLVKQAQPVLGKDWDLIVPVPLHSVKRRERDFNQAERLANCLGKATGIPVNTRLVRRVIPTESQTRLNRAQRATNVQNAFEPVTKGKLTGERVILIDDILTTCSTTNACAKALRQAGAGEICVWAVARGI